MCAQGSSQTDTFLPGCSYVYLAPKAAPAYTYLSSQGAVSWKGGTVTGGALAFPAAGQTWPGLTGLYLNSGTVVTPKAITGTVGADGRVDLRLDYDLRITLGSAQCTLTGTTALSSQATETLGGQATGRNHDPATGGFAVASTSYGTPAQSGDCLTVNAAYDLSKGLGWYLTGTMSLPAAPVAQTAKVKLPNKLKAAGKTVLLDEAVVTNAGQSATAKLSWSTRRRAAGHKAKYATAKIRRSGKVTIRTTGQADKLYVKLVLAAPAVPGYRAYTFTKKWTVKQ